MAAVHLFLSPHLDDAILNCGGVMHDLARRGERVVIVTVMAGEPTDDLPDTPSLRAVKALWANGQYQISARRLEDARAARTLGAAVVQMPFLECLFRTARYGDGSRAPLYPHDDSPFAEYDHADDTRTLLLERQSPVRREVDTIYAPLCADSHVDHRLVRDWSLVLTGAKNAPALKFCEEYPSNGNKITVARALDFYRQEMPALTLQLESAVLDDTAVNAKIRALRCYQSHVPVLWQTLDVMEKSIREYLLLCGEGQPAERLWKVSANTPTPDDGTALDIIA